MNKSNQEVNLEPIAKKLLPYYHLVDKSLYPIKVIIYDKKDFYDRSHFDLETNIMTLKIDLKKQPIEDVYFLVAHEFFHFVQRNNEQIRRASLSKEHYLLINIFRAIFRITEDQVQEIFHDFLPAEVTANSFSTMVVGKFYKRHSFQNILKFLKNRN